MALCSAPQSRWREGGVPFRVASAMTNTKAVRSSGSASKAVDQDRIAAIVITAVAMVAFAANSVLCRVALTQTEIDPASFTLVRIVSGAVMLTLLFGARSRSLSVAGSWPAAIALFVYAAAFAFAYLFASRGRRRAATVRAVQVTMVVTGLIKGEHVRPLQWVGLVFAFSGLAVLVAPGVSAPSPIGAILMLAAGVAWGAYSLMGQANTNALGATTGNFLRAAPIALLLALPTLTKAHPALGLIYAVLSGALASGVGYSMWYLALLQPHGGSRRSV